MTQCMTRARHAALAAVPARAVPVQPRSVANTLPGSHTPPGGASRCRGLRLRFLPASALLRSVSSVSGLTCVMISGLVIDYRGLSSLLLSASWGHQNKIVAIALLSLSCLRHLEGAI